MKGVPEARQESESVPVCDTGHIPAWWEAPGWERREQDLALLVEKAENPHSHHTGKTKENTGQAFTH